MGLAESIAKHNARPTGLVAILDKLDGQSRADLLDAIDNPAVAHVAIARALTDHGVPIGESAVRRWREARRVNGL